MAHETEDARASLRALAERLRRAALDVAWRQWRAVGGATTTKTAARAMVDPEALVLLSLTLMRDERRLADLLHGWAARNSGLLSTQRAKNLANDYPEEIRARLAWFAHVAIEEGKDIRWRTLVARVPATSVAASRPAALRANKVRVAPVRLTDPPSLLLRLRRGFGVGVKADVLSFLLGIEDAWATVRTIVAATEYTAAAVRRAADDMTAARLIHVLDGPPASYRAERGAWSRVFELDDGPPPWRSWHERFSFVAAFLSWADATQARPLSLYAFGAHGREILERHRAAFERSCVVVWNEYTPVDDWADFVTHAVTTLSSWMVEQA